MSLTHVIIVVVALAGSLCDVRTRRIPNYITFGAAAVGFAYAFATSGWLGLGMSMAGWLVGCALFLPLFFLRGLGAGDVKFLAAFGAWFGPAELFSVFFYTALAGGLMALVLVFARGYFQTAFQNIWLLLCHWRVAGLKPHPEVTLDNPRAPRLPYGVAIAAGAITTIWLH
jgi:prepilin peptidase CpaA